MIVNLFASSTDPNEYRDQLNASFRELAAALRGALIGEIISYGGGGTYAHGLGVKPELALVQSEIPIALIEVNSGDWTASSVYIEDDSNIPVGAPILLLGFL